MRMKMVIFKVLTLFLVTTAARETTPPTTDQSQRVKLDTDAIKVFFFEWCDESSGCLVNFGLFGARQVVITYKNLTTNEGEIKLFVDGDTYDSKKVIAEIDVSSAIKVGETTYEVTEMVDIEPGSRKVYITVPQPTKHDQIEKEDDDDDLNFDPFRPQVVRLASSRETNSLEVKSVSFIPKKLNSENPYRIISTSNNLGITIKSWDNRLREKITPILHDSICEDRQSFFFQQNEKGEYRIMKIYKGMTEQDVKYLEVRDRSRKIGNEVILVKYPGSEDNAWSVLSGRSKGEVKIQSKLTGTCISAIHGLGSDLVMVNCEKGQDNNWSLKFCYG